MASNLSFSDRLAQRSRADQKRSKAIEVTSLQRKKKKKNEPAVLSTKIPISQKRMVVAVGPKREVRDPRFDNLSGRLDQGAFQKSYDFVEEKRSQELKELEDLLKVTTDQDEREIIVAQIKELKHHQIVMGQKQTQYELKVRVKARKKKLLEETDGRAKLNKKRIREIELEERYSMLEKDKKLDKYLGKRRKKLQQKNKRSIPNK